MCVDRYFLFKGFLKKYIHYYFINCLAFIYLFIFIGLMKHVLRELNIMRHNQDRILDALAVLLERNSNGMLHFDHLKILA